MSSPHPGGIDPNGSAPAQGAAPMRYVQRHPGAPPELVPVGSPYPSASVPPPPRRTGLIVSLIAGGVVLLLVLGGVFVVQSFIRTVRGPVAGEEDLAAARSTVEDYLTAISEGDAVGALTYVHADDDEELLTDEVLASSNARGGIGEFVVGDAVDKGHGDIGVEVKFGTGADAMSYTYRVYDLGGWRIADGLVDAGSAAYALAGLDPTVNGFEIRPESASLFPGTYDISIESEYLTVVGEGQYRLVGGSAEDVSEIDIRLSDRGEQRFRELVTAAVAQCIASTAVDTECGFTAEGLFVDGGLSVGHRPVDGTVHRSLTPDGAAQLAGLVSDSLRGAVAYSYTSIEAVADYAVEKDGVTTQVVAERAGPMRFPQVDFSLDDPVVVWE